MSDTLSQHCSEVKLSKLNMRIAVVNFSRCLVGGVETYLDSIIPELSGAGHEIAFLAESDGPPDVHKIHLPDGSPSWSVAALGEVAALNAVQSWRPDLVYVHKLTDPDLERRVLNLAPSVLFVHDYSGTCISGDKAFKFPIVQPCSRKFGRQCLLHYFPHRCGGANPITMFTQYSLGTQRLQNLHRYDAVVTHSDHMVKELMKHGLAAQRAFPLNEALPLVEAYQAPEDETPSFSTNHSQADDNKKSFHLVFCGRMEYLKGGHILIEALPSVTAALGKPLRITFAGAGREREALIRQASRLQNAELEFDFVGWLERPRLEELFRTCDLLVVPSLWPEPFGLVGAEAGKFGVPAAAFAVGGISDWLADGLNGFLAPGSPPTAEGLARAIVTCLENSATHLRLRRGAVALASRFNMKSHLTVLLQVFESVLRHQPSLSVSSA